MSNCHLKLYFGFSGINTVLTLNVCVSGIHLKTEMLFKHQMGYGRPIFVMQESFCGWAMCGKWCETESGHGREEWRCNKSKVKLILYDVCVVMRFLSGALCVTTLNLLFQSIWFKCMHFVEVFLCFSARNGNFRRRKWCDAAIRIELNDGWALENLKS